MVVRGAPAIGIAAAYGYRARGRARRGPAEADARAARVAADRGQPRLGARPDARRPDARALHGDCTGDEVDRCRRDGRARRGAASRRDARAHALQRGRARDRRLRQRRRRAARGERARPARARLGRRDTAAAAGRAADRVGARDGRDPAHGDRRLGRRVADGGGEVDCVVTGADRIAANGDTANKIGTYSLAVLARHHGIPLYVVAPTSTVDLATPDGAAIPIEERDPAEVTARFAAAQPCLRRDAGRADRGDRHRARGAPRAVDTALAQRRGRRVKALDPRGGLRDPAASAHRHLGEGAAPGRGPADHRLDRRPASTRSAEIDEVHVVTNASEGAGVRALGRGARGHRPRRRHERRTRTGSARSATCSS